MIPVLWLAIFDFLLSKITFVWVILLKLIVCLNGNCLQQAYFKCAYECFDRTRKQEEITNCVEHCSVPVVRAQQHFENEMAKFQVSSFDFITWFQRKFYAILTVILYLAYWFIRTLGPTVMINFLDMMLISSILQLLDCCFMLDFKN